MSDKTHNYTCQDYRQEMILLSLKKRLQDPELPEKDKREIEQEIQKLEKEMDLD